MLFAFECEGLLSDQIVDLDEMVNLFKSFIQIWKPVVESTKQGQ